VQGLTFAISDQTELPGAVNRIFLKSADKLCQAAQRWWFGLPKPSAPLRKRGASIRGSAVQFGEQPPCVDIELYKPQSGDRLVCFGSRWLSAERLPSA
jgi:hypothetical protein